MQTESPALPGRARRPGRCFQLPYWDGGSGPSQPAGCRMLLSHRKIPGRALSCVCTSRPSARRSLAHSHTQSVRTHSVAIMWLLVHFWVSAHSKPLTHSKGTFISRRLAQTWELKSAGNAEGFQQLPIEEKNPLCLLTSLLCYSLFHLFHVV